MGEAKIVEERKTMKERERELLEGTERKLNFDGIW